MSFEPETPLFRGRDAVRQAAFMERKARCDAEPLTTLAPTSSGAALADDGDDAGLSQPTTACCRYEHEVCHVTTSAMLACIGVLSVAMLFTSCAMIAVGVEHLKSADRWAFMIAVRLLIAGVFTLAHNALNVGFFAFLGLYASRRMQWAKFLPFGMALFCGVTLSGSASFAMVLWFMYLALWPAAPPRTIPSLGSGAAAPLPDGLRYSAIAFGAIFVCYFAATACWVAIYLRVRIFHSWRAPDSKAAARGGLPGPGGDGAGVGGGTSGAGAKNV